MRPRNAPALVDEAMRVMSDVRRRAAELLRGIPDTLEPTAAELWRDASPKLDKALAAYDRKEAAETPESSWVPGRVTKRSCQQDLETILDTVLAVLGTCGAAGCRERIRRFQADNAASQARLAGYREQMLSAPAEASQDVVSGLLKSSRESLTDSIADETDRIAERDQQIENLKAGFREHLQRIGVSVSAETADSFLLPVEDAVVSMAAVISNIGLLTGRLQELVDQSREAPAETRRYYGIYVLLVFAVDRIQAHFVSEIDERFLPRIAQFREEASRHITDARAQQGRGGPKEALEANIAANGRTLDACRLLADTLESQRRSVLDEIRKVRILEQAAVNTYKTVCLSLNVAELAGYCEEAFRALRELRLPQLRPFQGARLNDELQRLAERVATKG